MNPAISLRKVFRVKTEVKTELKIMWQLGGKYVVIGWQRCGNDVLA